MDFKILEINTDLDHVHLLLNSGHLWNLAYYIQAVSDTLEDNIKEYISN